MKASGRGVIGGDADPGPTRKQNLKAQSFVTGLGRGRAGSDRIERVKEENVKSRVSSTNLNEEKAMMGSYYSSS